MRISVFIAERLNPETISLLKKMSWEPTGKNGLARLKRLRSLGKLDDDCPKGGYLNQSQVDKDGRARNHLGDGRVGFKLRKVSPVCPAVGSREVTTGAKWMKRFTAACADLEDQGHPQKA